MVVVVLKVFESAKCFSPMQYKLANLKTYTMSCITGNNTINHQV